MGRSGKRATKRRVKLPKHLQEEIISRIKVIGRMNIAEGCRRMVEQRFMSVIA